MADSKHLSKQEIDQCVKAINLGLYRELDKTILDHIAECDICANEINKISTIFEEEKALLNQINATKTET